MEDSQIIYLENRELAEVLENAARTGRTIRVQMEGKTYKLGVSSESESADVWQDYDPEAAREAVYASAGVLAGSGIDVEEWLEEIRESRKQDTPGRPSE